MESQSIADCPILSLPHDILSKVIAFVPIAQWTSLELVDPNFREATALAWRALRSVNLELDFIDMTTESILEQLLARAPFLTNVRGVRLETEGDADLNLLVLDHLSQFENLESLSIDFLACDDPYFYDIINRIPLENLIRFLRSSRSRTKLKQIEINDPRLYETSIQLGRSELSARFEAAFALDGLKLEKIHISVNCPDIRLNTIDASRLVELRFGKSPLHPSELSPLIDRAPNLNRLDFSFWPCRERGSCRGERQRANKDLLASLANHQKLAVLKFDSNIDPKGCLSGDIGCMSLRKELLETLESLGRRGQLRKLSFKRDFVFPRLIDIQSIIAVVSRHLPHLRSIELPIDDCNDLEQLLAIAEMPELEELHFSYEGAHDDQYHWLPGAVLQGIGTHQQRLTRLALDTFPPGTERALEGLTRLRDLRIQNAMYMSKQMLVAWSRTIGPNLRVLMLGGIGVYENGSEDGVIALIKSAVQLRVLMLEGYVSDRLLRVVAESCPNLNQFGVKSRWSYVYASNLQAIVDRCPNLKRLGGFGGDLRKGLRLERYRKIGVIDTEFWKRDFFESYGSISYSY